MNPTRRSFLYSFGEKYALLLLATVGTMLISRILTPAEIGVYSVGAMLAGLAHVVRDFGVGQYVIQEKELTQEKLRAALGASLCAAWLLALVVFAAAAPMSRFYATPRLEHVLWILALNFALVPLTAIVLPCLRRAMRFGAIFAINGAHGVCQLACTLTLALSGYGSLSLAWGALAGTGGALLASCWLRPAGMPWRPAVRGIGAIARFGGYATAGGLIDEAGVAAPDLIAGKLVGMEGAGILSKAQGMIGLFNQAITSAVSPVFFPLYAAHARTGADVLPVYLTTVSCMTALAWPFFTFLGAMAPPIVRLLYGDQWGAAVPLIRIICFASALYSMFSMARYLFVATGHVRAQARLDAQAVPVRIVALLLAAPLGLEALAWAIVLGSVFRSWLTWRYLRRIAGLQWPALHHAVRGSAGLAALTALAVFAAHAVIAAPYPMARLAGAALLALALWLAGLVRLRHPLANELGVAVRAWRRRTAGNGER